MNTITEKLADIARELVALETDPDRYGGDLGRLAHDARATLAEYEATRYGVRIPEEFARKTLADYNAEIATGTVNYPFYAGAFSQLVRGVVE